MNKSFLFDVSAPIIALVLFICILATNWLGFKYRRFQLKKKNAEEIDGIGSIEGAMLGLLALLMAFSFGMAASKFDERRKQIVEEANDIGTAVLRCDMFPDSIRKLLRADFAKYVEARIAYYDAVEDDEKITAALQNATAISTEIWNRATHLSQNRDNFVASGQMIPALNTMIDIVATRESSRISKVPPIILFILLLLIITSSFLIGFGNKGKHRNLVMVIGFAVMTTMALYLILELDRPRRGIINIDTAEKNITDLRNFFTENR